MPAFVVAMALEHDWRLQIGHDSRQRPSVWCPWSLRARGRRDSLWTESGAKAPEQGPGGADSEHPPPAR